jgi:flagellar biosynthesis protein FliR
MAGELAGLVALAQASLLALAMLFARTGAVVALLPGIGEYFIPLRVKLAAAIAMTLLLFPILWNRFPQGEPAPSVLAQLISAEALAGLVLGLGLRFTLIAIQIAGSIIAQSTSISQFGASGPMPEPSPAIGSFLTLTAMVLALSGDLHTRSVELIALSYELMPPGQFPQAAILADWGTGRVAWAFSAGVAMTASFLVITFLINIGFGAINRTMPALMVSFVGAPLVTGAGLLLFWALAPDLFGYWSSLLDSALTDPFSAIP